MRASRRRTLPRRNTTHFHTSSTYGAANGGGFRIAPPTGKLAVTQVPAHHQARNTAPHVALPAVRTPVPSSSAAATLRSRGPGKEARELQRQQHGRRRCAGLGSAPPRPWPTRLLDRGTRCGALPGGKGAAVGPCSTGWGETTAAAGRPAPVAAARRERDIAAHLVLGRDEQHRARGTRRPHQPGRLGRDRLGSVAALGHTPARRAVPSDRCTSPRCCRPPGRRPST